MEKESLVFKIAESLRCFLLMWENQKEIELPLEDKTLHKDISKVLNAVRVHGFYPSPYSPIPDVKDQYTDFAAFCLEFCDLVHGYAEAKGIRNVQQLSSVIARKAFAFLTNKKHYKEDAKGCRWAGTNKIERKTKATEYYTDAYFTSIAIIALRRVLAKPVLGLRDPQRDRVRSLIRSAGRWIVSRQDAGLLTGDENKSIKKLIYTTWGLRALVETFDIQDDDVRAQVRTLATEYLKAIRLKRDRDTVSLGQEYLTILSPSVDAPLYYEDRSDWGGILLALLSLRKVSSLDSIFDSDAYNELIQSIYTDLLLLRDPVTKLWYKGKLILSIHAYLVEGFLLYKPSGREFGSVVNITPNQLRRALKETVGDESFLSTMHDLVYDKLNKIIVRDKSDEVIDTGIEGVAKEVPQNLRKSEHPRKGKHKK
ncbi:MAG: hypothetical protein WBW16_04595 [Bacteroidota bacterium]